MSLSVIAVSSFTFACSDPGPAATDGSGGAPAIPPVVATGNIVSTETLADGTVLETTDDGYTIATASDGTVTITAPDGTKTVTSPDGTITTTAVDGTITVTFPDGTTTTTRPNEGAGGTGSGGLDGAGGLSGTGATEGSGGAQVSAATWIPSNGRISASNNTFGIQGDWYAFGDGTTTDQSGNPYEDGKNCVHGVSTGEEGNWGAGLGLDLNNLGEKLPYVITGRVTGFRMRITGAIPSPARLSFVADPNVDVNPFIEVTPGTESVIYNIGDAQVPFSWTVDNAGARVEDVVYSVQLLAPGDSEAGAIDLCIEEFEPVYDESAINTGVEGTAFINSDGFVRSDENDYGLQGPVYVITDGNSTTQSGIPYQDGKYCVAGEFLGGADDWGAGIAFDLNHPPGVDRAAFDPTGNVAAFRVGLSGSTPGGVRIQYVVNEPQTDDQPFLVGQMNTSAMYPIAWAQVPASWEVPDAGLEVTDSIVTMQIFLEGDKPGPFNVCVEELAPLGASEVVYAASAADAGYNGFKTFDEARFANEYAMWKDRHFQDCGDGSACVPRDDGDCISEGIGYGMLITVGYDDQTAFDQLWAYFKKNMRSSGLMNWQTTACGGVIGDGAATDGDIDAAMALIQAGCKWGGTYAADAATLINSISTNAVASCSGESILMPGDDFGGCSETNPSYVAPGYYRVFEQVTGNSVWTDLLNSGYDLVAANQARKGGEFSDWSNDAGQPATTGNHSDDFGPDASRVPWRMATDYVWNAEPRAAAILDTFRDHVDSLGGTQRAFTPNSNYRGGSAFSAIHTDAATAQEYADAWLLTSVDDATYFPGTLRPIYMLLAANKFENGCN
jgi:hypothetical protein